MRKITKSKKRLKKVTLTKTGEVGYVKQPKLVHAEVEGVGVGVFFVDCRGPGMSLPPPLPPPLRRDCVTAWLNIERNSLQTQNIDKVLLEKYRGKGNRPDIRKKNTINTHNPLFKG